MPRFYFHFRDGTLLEDDTGEELPNAEAALRHGRRMAAELAEDLEAPNAAVIVSDGLHNLAEVPLHESLTVR